MTYLLKYIKLHIKTSEFMVCTIYFIKTVKIFWISKKKYSAKEKEKKYMSKLIYSEKQKAALENIVFLIR